MPPEGFPGRIGSLDHVGGEHETMATFRSRQHANRPYDLLPPEPKPRPAAPQRRLRGGDVVDADFVVVRGEGTFRPTSRSNDNRPRIMPHQGGARLADHVAMLTGLVARVEQGLRCLSERSFSAVVALMAVAVFALAGGLAGIAGASAPGPGVENPLDISHVTLTTEESGGMKVLVVRGIVENRSGGTVAVPDIRADLVSGERMVASTIIAPPATAMFSGHSRGFAARLPHPGGKDPQIKLSFTTAAVARP